MTPSLTAHNSMALLAAYAIERAKLYKGYTALRIAGSYFFNDSICQFCRYMLLPLFTRQPMARVKNILLVRNPLKIAYVIIGWVVINMVDFMNSRAWANKNTRYELMNQWSTFTPISAKLNAAMPIFSFFWDQNFPTANTKNVSKIGDFVKGFVARNGHKDFIHIKPLLVDSSVSVAWQLAQKPAFGSYPSQAGGF